MSAPHPLQRNKTLNQALDELYDDCKPEIKQLIDSRATVVLLSFQHAGGSQLSLMGAREIVLRLMACCGLEILE